jgi:DNA modification methylase
MTAPIVSSQDCPPPGVPTAGVLVWHGCYDASWRGVIVPEAFAHPAKFAPGLIQRIYLHGFDAGWWTRGDTIGDPFGGIAGGGVMAGYEGLNWIGVELEPRFVELGNKNLAKHGPKWMAMSLASRVTLLQGDSRRFAEIVRAAGIVTSPPFLDRSREPHALGAGPASRGVGDSAGRVKGDYQFGDSEGQIERLRHGTVDAVLTSPPYNPGDKADGTTADRDPRADRMRGSFRTSEAYGSAPGQIGELAAGDIDAVVTSPPYEETNLAQKDRRTWASRMDQIQRAVDRGDDVGEEFRRILAKGVNPNSNLRIDGYGTCPEQIGNEKGQTYWQAMRQVYGQCFLALRPGGVMCVVVKDYVKDKKRVPLCDDTLRLLTHLGFEPVVRIHAMLTREHRHAGLFGGTIVTRKERKSFFRRLAEKKGSPRIDHEEVLVVRKPERAKLPTAGAA